MYYFSASPNSLNEASTLVVNLPRGEQIVDLLERMYKTSPAVLQQADLIIIRLNVSQSVDAAIFDNTDASLTQHLWYDELFDTPISQTFIRFPDRPVFFLFTQNYVHKLSPNINPSATNNLFGSEDAYLVLMEELCAAEMDALVETGHAILPPIPNFVYRAPSGYAQDAFLRVGNIQRSKDALDAIFFWMLPHLRLVRGIVTETWSIASTGLNVGASLAIYRKDKHPCPVEMLQSYLQVQSQAEEAADIIEEMLKFARKDFPEDEGSSKILFLQSAVNSGTLFERLQEPLYLRGIPLENLCYLTLFALGKAKPKFACLRDLTSEAGLGRFAPIEHKYKSDDIVIDPQTYFISQFQDVEVTLTVNETRHCNEFIKRYGDCSIFRVHKDVIEGTNRHHAIWIDTVALAKSSDFVTKFESHIVSLSPAPRLIIAPDHAAGDILSKVASDCLKARGLSAQRISHPDLDLDLTLNIDKSVASAIEGLSDKDAILLLDDCFITGDRIKTFQKHMRRYKFGGKTHYVIGVARPEKLESWLKCKRMLAYFGNTVAAIECLLLPNWDERTCPWCAEASLYQQIVEQPGSTSLSNVIQQRRQKIETGGASGLREGLFCHPDGELSPDFQRYSIFTSTDRSEADLFTAVASSLQYLRNSTPQKPTLGPRHYPVATVFNCLDYLKDTFNESKIRACILRALHDYEMNYTSNEKEAARSDLVHEILASEDPKINELVVEILIATRLGKFSGCSQINIGAALAQFDRIADFEGLLKL